MEKLIQLKRELEARLAEVNSVLSYLQASPIAHTDTDTETRATVTPIRRKTAQARPTGGLRQALLTTLEQSGHAISTQDLITALQPYANDVKTPLRVRLFQLLGKMRKNGEIKKDGDFYRLAA